MTARKKRTPTPKKDGLAEMTKTANAMAETMNPVVTLSDGTEVTIHKCKAKNIGVILEAVGFVFEELGIKNLADTPEIDLLNPSVLMPLIAKSSGRLLFIASELSSLEHDELLELELDDALTIIKRAYEVNQGFFLQSVLPQIQFLFQEKE